MPATVTRLRDFAAAEQARALAIGQATADAAEIVRLFGLLADVIDGLRHLDVAGEETITDLAGAILDAADNVGHALNGALDEVGALGTVNIDWSEAGMTDLRRDYAGATRLGVRWARRRR